jgi:predicted nuclease of predicted toxin-antitoxin system
MKLYLDEDTAWSQLVQALHRAGHDTQTTIQSGLAGEWDPVQMMYAIQEDRCILTRNYCDFQDLHNLLASAHGHHSGVVVIRRDDDTRRNMSPRDIVRALANFETAGLPMTDQYIVLNQWQ